MLTASLPAERIQDMTHCLLFHKLPPVVIAPEDHAVMADYFIWESDNYGYVFFSTRSDSCFKAVKIVSIPLSKNGKKESFQDGLLDVVMEIQALIPGGVKK